MASFPSSVAGDVGDSSATSRSDHATSTQPIAVTGAMPRWFPDATSADPHAVSATMTPNAAPPAIQASELPGSRSAASDPTTAPGAMPVNRTPRA